MNPARRPAPLLLGLLLALLSACAPGAVTTPFHPPTSGPDAHVVTATAAPSPTGTPNCDPRITYAPLPGDVGRLPAAEEITDRTLRAIKQRGYLIVGVSADTRLLGSVVPQKQTFEGFDIDLARAVATAMFGDPDKIRFVSISAAERESVLEAGSVDMVSRAMSMTCARWKKVAFSAEYLTAYQRLLVHGLAGTANHTSIADMDGKRVCAPAATSSIARLASYPKVIAVAAESHTACLVLFQENEVDAITGDDTILAGLAAQDDYAVVSQAPPMANEPYGLGFNAHDVTLVRYVNAVLRQYEAPDAQGVSDWTRSYDKWFRSVIGGRGAPAPLYGRAIPAGS